MKNYYGDIRDKRKLERVIKFVKPDIIFHLAAQSLVKKSYKNPSMTFTTNAIGTLNILEIIKDLKSLKSAVIITSDKCYKNKEKKILIFPFSFKNGHFLKGRSYWKKLSIFEIWL